MNIANQLFPKAESLKKGLKRIDLLLKFEEIVSQMTSIFFWCSIFDIWLWCMSFFVFCFHPI